MMMPLGSITKDYSLWDFEPSTFTAKVTFCPMQALPISADDLVMPTAENKKVPTRWVA